MDTTTAEMLAGLISELQARRIDLAFARVRAPLRTALDRNGVLEHLGEHHVHVSLRAAVNALTGGKGPTPAG